MKQGKLDNLSMFGVLYAIKQKQKQKNTNKTLATSSYIMI